MSCRVERPYLREDSSGVAVVIVDNISEDIAESAGTLRSTFHGTGLVRNSLVETSGMVPCIVNVLLHNPREVPLIQNQQVIKAFVANGAPNAR